MTYALEIKPSAERDIRRLDGAAQARVEPALQSLAANPRPAQSKKLQGGHGYRLRVGDYRVLYTVDDGIRIIAVYRVGHRRDVYRDL